MQNVRYAWRERKTPYLDNIALKKQYLESRERYRQKVNSVFVHNSGNLVEAFDELASAVDYSDTSNLWQRKASLAKTINDNRDDLRGALIGLISGYSTSVGAFIPLAAETGTEGLNAVSGFFFWALLAVVAFGIYTGTFNQNRLSRLVKEHKDYTGEFEEITDLLDRKKEMQARA
ncbi:MAG TPA: hypothetical protein VEH86_04425 [Candidatus Acidoferrum sp.]|nr:hypothetical protein [Candidatus Acidoferrum sp.]